jgi:hypothetical protein
MQAIQYSYRSATKNSVMGWICSSEGKEKKKSIQNTGTEISMKTPLSALAGKQMANIKSPRLKYPKYQRPLLFRTLSQYHPSFISTTYVLPQNQCNIILLPKIQKYNLMYYTQNRNKHISNLLLNKLPLPFNGII